MRVQLSYCRMDALACALFREDDGSYTIDCMTQMDSGEWTTPMIGEPKNLDEARAQISRMSDSMRVTAKERTARETARLADPEAYYQKHRSMHQM